MRAFSAARPLTRTAHPPRARRQWHYFFLTDEGIQYLKEYLHLPEDVVPATLKRVAGAEAAAGAAFGGERRGPGGFGGDRPRAPYGERREGGAPRGAPGAGGEGYRRSAAPQ